MCNIFLTSTVGYHEKVECDTPNNLLEILCCKTRLGNAWHVNSDALNVAKIDSQQNVSSGARKTISYASIKALIV